VDAKEKTMNAYSSQQQEQIGHFDRWLKPTRDRAQSDEEWCQPGHGSSAFRQRPLAMPIWQGNAPIGYQPPDPKVQKCNRRRQ